MRVLDPGHRYALRHLDGDGEEILQFVKRVGEMYPGNGDACPGTTIQEVLRALIERMIYVDNQAPSSDNRSVVILLRDVLFILEQRAARRNRIVLADALRVRMTRAPEAYRVPRERWPVCPTCGHWVCHHPENA